MRAIEERAFKEYGLTAEELMEAAGEAVAVAASVLRRRGSVCFVCGKGNNGGDGLVAARLLASQKIPVDVVLLASPGELSGAAKTAYDRLRKANVTVKSAKSLSQSLGRAHVVVDCILGTGVRGPLTSELAVVIDMVNSVTVPILAVDLPTGVRELGPNEPLGPAIFAYGTVSLGLPKLCLLDERCLDHVGHIVPLPLSFPPALLEDDSIKVNWYNDPELVPMLPARPMISNKGDFGRVGIVAGSPECAGAALLCARAALRTGCGLATIFTTAALNPIYKLGLPEATTVIVPGSADGRLTGESVSGILAAAGNIDAMVLGPGLGTTEAQETLVNQLIAGFTRPMVVDADALTCLSRGNLKTISGRKDIVLTPHPGEMARLTGKPVAPFQPDRIAAAREFARIHGCNLLLKGAGTVLARPDEQVYLNSGGTPVLATAGSGDVLCGIIASFCAQGLTTWKAAMLGARIHLLAGLLESDASPVGALASEIADTIPYAISELQDPRRTVPYDDEDDEAP
ncbi:MAG: NAD(P)H-hydrate dehydratase [Candidatus Sumerlaeaceae bacterium]|nr:NAD(P)H-hydrate dehydratase [Candidatus Sumerlaeaceae bacterium]